MESRNLLFLLCFISVTSIEAAMERLPSIIRPVNYDLTITLSTDAFTTDNFKGEVNIKLNVLQQTQQIRLHSKSLQFVDIDLRAENSTTNLTSEVNSTSDIVTITSTEPLIPGYYYLYINYNANFSLYDMTGLYKSTYRNSEGTTEFSVVTQFEATHARQAFPCFDEPAFKATFNLSVIYPKGYNVIANTLQKSTTEINNELEMVQFEPTPVMSTYLNAFVVSNFTCGHANGSVPFRVCSRSDYSSDREYALKVSPRLLSILENFTGVPYNITGIGKLDQVAIPDFSANAMENWGLVTYKERALLWNEYHTSNTYKQKVASVIAHEFAHMWFGDLVTLKWWSDAFLNEGFARYLQYVATSELEPDWEMEKQLVVEQVHSALLADSSPESKALSFNVTTQEELSARFDTISYNKGASVLRMIMHVMGLEQFQQGIRQYLQTNMLNNTTPGSLWNSLGNFTQNLNGSFADFVSNWTIRAGYPVLNVRLNGTNVIITQERFVIYGTDDTKWYVPITYTKANDANKFTYMQPQSWLTPNKNEIILENVILNKSDWIILNNQQIGFYRVNYDSTLWERIRSVLKTTPSEIHVINQAQIVDDLFNFARANKTSISQVLDTISFINNSTDYYTWYSAFEGFNYYLLKINNEKIYKNLTEFISKLMEKLYNSVSFDDNSENQIYSLKQAMATMWACKLGNTKCIDNSKLLFSAYKIGSSVNKNLRQTVYCTALQHSTNVQADWDFLWEKFQTAKVATEQLTLLSSLGCTSNEEILKRFLNLSINTNSPIRRQDSTFVFYSVLNGYYKGFKIVFRFITENYQHVIDHYKNENTVQMLLNNTVNRITDQSEIDEFLLLIQKGSLPSALNATTSNVLNIAKDRLMQTRSLEDQLSQYFPEISRSTATRRTGYVTVLTAIILLYYCAVNYPIII